MLGLLGVYIGRGIISAVRMYALGWLGQRIVYDLQRQIFQHLQLLSLTFYNKLSTGRIMTRVTSDTERMRRFITSGFQDIVIDGLTIVGICAMLFVMNWELALLSLIPIPFMIIGTIIYRNRIHWIFHRIWRRIAEPQRHARRLHSQASRSSRLLPKKTARSSASPSAISTCASRR